MTPRSLNPGMVYLVGAGPGDPGLITLRGLQCLCLAHVVIYDRLANHILLSYAAQNAELIDAGKEPDHHAVPQGEINALLLEHARAGKTVVRLKGGDPFVFGRGGEEAAALAEAGIPFEIVPGVSSAIAAPAYAGIPVTHRDLSCSVAFVTGHRSAEGGDAACDWQRLADGPDTLVFLMGVHSLPRIAEELIAHGRGAQTPAAVIAQATGPRQRTVTGPLSQIAALAKAAGIRAPAVIVVGDVVRLRDTLRWFDLPERRPLLGQAILVTGRRPQLRAAPADMTTNPATERMGLIRLDLVEPYAEGRRAPEQLTGAGTEVRGGRGWLLAGRLAELGAEAAVLEVAETTEVSDCGPLEAALHEVAAPPLGAGRAPRRAFGGWLVFPSVEAVSFTLDRFFRLGYDARALGGCKLHAADPQVAAALLAWGLRADQIGPAHGGFRTGQRTFWLAGWIECDGSPIQTFEVPETSKVLADLRRYGLLVREVPAFTLRPASLVNTTKLTALLEGSYTGLVLTSSLDVAFLERQLGALGGTLAGLPACTALICTDEATAAQARRYGAPVALVAGGAGVEGLAQAMTRASGYKP